MYITVVGVCLGLFFWKTIFLILCVSVFAYQTVIWYSNVVFESRKELRKAFLLVFNTALYTGCLIHCIWYGYRWFDEEVEDPTLFCLLVSGDLVVFSIITKMHENLINEIYLFSLAVSAVLFTALRLWSDISSWHLFSTVFSSTWLYTLIWSSPLLYEYTLIPESEHTQDVVHLNDWTEIHNTRLWYVN